ncbi:MULTISPECIES: TrkA C-terminal domain-containing protein [Persephonella]|uniref:TrkA-N domain family protein n=1 Tax=Persephonella marina (strain DSM 14350 / EX-H1) TaxID=123214 RepID=C0QSL5_PERMH|nr:MULTISPECIES: TrkA C-terminal domain-containing protein [Persephonella]ACO04796.1 TrkA-N domain family protein [Persephonella marina EX-H1]
MRRNNNNKHYGNVKPKNYRAIYEEKFYNILFQLRYPLMTVIFFTTLGVLMLMIINNKSDGQSVLNYFFHTVITFSTVGYTEGYGTENVNLNRFFSTLFIMISIPLVYIYGLVTTVNVFLNSNITEIFRYWRMYKAMDQLKGHYIICRFNGITRELMKNLKKRGIKYVLVEPDPALEEDIKNFGVEYYVIDEPHKRSVLLGVGIERAKGVISAFEENTQDLSVIVTARLIRPDKDKFSIFATATTEGAAEKMKLLGATEVIVPDVAVGRRMSSFVLHPPSPTLSGFLEKIAYGERTDIDIIEVKVDQNSDLIGKKLKEVKMRQETGATIVAIVRADGKMKIAPSGDAEIKLGDSLIILGHPKALRRAEEFFEAHHIQNKEGEKVS